MADDSPRALVCVIAGESSPFIVELAANKNLIYLKGLIKEKGKNGVLSGIDATDLSLWKVRMTLVVIRSDITGDTTLAYGGYPSYPI
jgi:hypothetical protein